MATIKKSGGKGRRLKPGTKAHKSQRKKIESRVDLGIGHARYSAWSEEDARKAKSLLNQLRKLEDRELSAISKKKMPKVRKK